MSDQQFPLLRQCVEREIEGLCRAAAYEARGVAKENEDEIGGGMPYATAVTILAEMSKQVWTDDQCEDHALVALMEYAEHYKDTARMMGDSLRAAIDAARTGASATPTQSETR